MTEPEPTYRKSEIGTWTQSGECPECGGPIFAGWYYGETSPPEVIRSCGPKCKFQIPQHHVIEEE